MDLYDVAYAVLGGVEPLTPADEIIAGLTHAPDISGRFGTGALGKAFSVDGTTAAVLMLSRHGDADGEFITDCAKAAESRGLPWGDGYTVEDTPPRLSSWSARESFPREVMPSLR